VIPPFPVYLFDIDGTLLDSAADICGAIHVVLAKTEQNGVSEQFLKRYIGRHLLALFGDLFPNHTAEQIDQMIAEYRAIYPARGHKCTRPYPGVAQALAQIGGRKSTATTKGTPTSRLVLEQFGLLSYFDHVQGTDGFPPKPEPDVIFKSIELFGVRPEDCLMVGDSAADMEAGRRAGVAICAVRYGYGDPAEMARFNPDYWIDDLRQLAE
jgi:HAD superfamily hydrolase (TIGR01509 family)